MKLYLREQEQPTESSFISLSNGLQAKGLFCNGMNPFKFQGLKETGTGHLQQEMTTYTHGKNASILLQIDSEIKISGKYVWPFWAAKHI